MALLLFACDRVVHVSGRIRGEGGAATGACKGLLHDPGQWGGQSHDVALPNDFDQGVLVDPLRRPRYTFIISCEQCSGTVRSPEFVAGQVNLGVIMVPGCSGSKAPSRPSAGGASQRNGVPAAERAPQNNELQRTRPAQAMEPRR